MHKDTENNSLHKGNFLTPPYRTFKFHIFNITEDLLYVVELNVEHDFASTLMS